MHFKPDEDASVANKHTLYKYGRRALYKYDMSSNGTELQSPIFQAEAHVLYLCNIYITYRNSHDGNACNLPQSIKTFLIFKFFSFIFKILVIRVKNEVSFFILSKYVKFIIIPTTVVSGIKPHCMQQSNNKTRTITIHVEVQ